MLRLWANRSGSTLPIFGIGLMTVFAVVGVSLATSMDQRSSSSLQASADAAALAGATAFITGPNASAEVHLADAQQAAESYARSNIDGTPKRIDAGAVTTDEYGQHTRVEVEIEYHPANVFRRWSGGDSDTRVIKRAAAEATREFPLCLLALATDGVAIELKGGATLEAAPCAIWSNSDDFSSVDIGNNAKLDSQSLCSVGRIRGKVSTGVTGTVTENCQSIPDPLRDWSPPSYGICDSIGGLKLNARKGTLLTVDPGVYCGGLWLMGESVSLKPGVYVMKDGPLVIKADQSVVGEGVTIIMSGELSTVEISGQGKLRLVAPKDGPLAGMAIAEDRNTTVSAITSKLPGKGVKKLVGNVIEPVSNISGQGSMYIEGAIYLPSQVISISGQGLGEKASPYLQIVAKRIAIGGQGKLAIDFREAEISVPVVIEPERSARLVR